jgi:hypothetical protein
MVTSSVRPIRVFFVALVLAAFLLNWLWEIAQMPAYAAPARSLGASALAHVVPGLGDVAITLGVYGIAALADGRLSWGMTGGWNVYATAALLGGTCAAAYELIALAQGWWSYSDLMPVVPVLGVGLWPLLQLTLLIPAAVRCAVWWAGRS